MLQKQRQDRVYSNQDVISIQEHANALSTGEQKIETSNSRESLVITGAEQLKSDDENDSLNRRSVKKKIEITHSA